MAYSVFKVHLVHLYNGMFPSCFRAKRRRSINHTQLVRYRTRVLRTNICSFYSRSSERPFFRTPVRPNTCSGCAPYNRARGNIGTPPGTPKVCQLWQTPDKNKSGGDFMSPPQYASEAERILAPTVLLPCSLAAARPCTCCRAHTCARRPRPALPPTPAPRACGHS